MKRTHVSKTSDSRPGRIRVAWRWLTFVIYLLQPRQEFASGEAESASSMWRHEEIRRFAASEAVQGVAADEQFVYVIANRAIGKYRKKTGERLGGWAGPLDGPIVHLNAGLAREGRLYCSHSNYPGVPTLSSVEIWDTATMKHVGTHSFGIDAGSLTWLDRRDGQWIACFAQYAKAGAEAGRDPSWTQIIQFDDQWRRTAGWVFPRPLTDRFAGYSSSGGAFGPGGLLFATGHDAKELYVLSFPEAGSVLKWVETIPINAEGQSFCWDLEERDIFYSISRRTREVIVSRISRVSR